jgi:hypothetical protein
MLTALTFTNEPPVELTGGFVVLEALDIQRCAAVIEPRSRNMAGYA